MSAGEAEARPQLTVRLSPYRLGVFGVAVVAFLVRLTPVLRGGGLASYGRYDDGVYYAAADSLTFGRVPYRDFLLLHPPGLVLVLTPFAVVGRLTSDPTGMASGRMFFMMIGALNAVLVALVVRRWSQPGGLLAGLLYACWTPAVYAEQSTTLEPLGTTSALVALLLLTKTPQPSSGRAQLLAGAALGVGLTMKIWYVVPVAVIVAWQTVGRGKRPVARVLAGVGATSLPMLLPFFLLAPSQMFRMVVQDQVLRPQSSGPLARRLASMLGLAPLIAHHRIALSAATVIGVLLVVGAAIWCCRIPSARILVVWLASNVAVLGLSPTYFAHYAELTAAPAATVLGVAAGALIRADLSRWPRAVAAGLLVVILASGVTVASSRTGLRFDGHRLSAAASTGCVASDDPTILIEMNRLSRDLREGCRVPVDVSGITYDTLSRSTPGGGQLSRRQNVAWQRFLDDYLTSAGSFVVARGRSDGQPGSGSRILTRLPALATSGNLTLRRGYGPP